MSQPGDISNRYGRTVSLDGADSLAQIARMVRDGSAVLDLGTSSGALGRYLTEAKQCVVDGVELDDSARELARPYYRTLLSLNLETADLGAQFQTATYDAIICADVLEHLRDPGLVLRQLAPLLRAEGKLIISVPNIGYAGLVATLIAGEFEYRRTGILDSTHLRFFTRKSLLELLAKSGFGAQRIQSVLVDPTDSEFAEQLRSRVANNVVGTVLQSPDALAYQFIIEAQPGPHAEAVIAQLAHDAPLPSPRGLVITTQLYWSGAEGNFSEDQTVLGISGPATGQIELSLNLPAQCGPIARLRLDPVNCTGYFRVDELALRSASGALLWRWDGHAATLAARHELALFTAPDGLTWLSTGNDPSIELPLSAEVCAQLDGASMTVRMSWPRSSLEESATRVLRESDAHWEAQSRILAERLALLETQLSALSPAAIDARVDTKLNSQLETRLAPHGAAMATLEREIAEQRAISVAEFARLREAHGTQDKRLGKLEKAESALDAGIAELRATAAGFAHLAESLVQRVSQLEQSPLAEIGRAARTTVLRPCVSMIALPARHLEIVDAARGDWRATDAEPSFTLTPRDGRFPTHWVQLQIELTYDGPSPGGPVLHVDNGLGYSAANAIRLPRPIGGKIEALVHLGTSVQALRLDPIDRAGTFRLGKVDVQEMGKLEAGMRMAAPLARRALSEPRKVPTRLTGLIQTLRADGVRGLRARLNETFRAASGEDERARSYAEWIAAYDTRTPAEIAAIEADCARLRENGPLISIVMPVFEPPERWLRRAIESVYAQHYAKWELCIADDASRSPHVRRVLEEVASGDSRIKVTFRDRNGHISEASNSALELATGEYVALLDHDDELPPHALYLVAAEISAHPDVDLIYSDEDKIDINGRRFGAYFKPEWDPDLFGAQNYFSHLGVYRTALVRSVGGFRKGFEGSQDYDLALRCIERTERVRHIPHVLYHWRAIEGSTARAIGEKSYAQSAAERALRDHFARTDPNIEVMPGKVPTVYRVRRSVPANAPMVSIVIPTYDGHGLLRRCIESISKRTSYPRFEILVVDNQSRNSDTLRYLAELEAARHARIVRSDSELNDSATMNLGAREARGELLCLLSESVETIDAGWLSELVSQAVRPEVGAVGAKLLYRDNTIEHAGIVTGIHGIAGHVHRRVAREFPGYFGRAQIVQRMTAVNAACLCVRRSIYEEVGGLDSKHLPMAFNDVDFCLRIAEAGYRNIYTPFAELYHHEAESLGSDQPPLTTPRFEAEERYMLERWGEKLKQDPAYSPNLSLGSDHFGLAWPPRAAQGWRDVSQRR